MWKVTDLSGRPVNEGDKLTSFRGETHTFIGVERGPMPGKSAKVRTEKGVYYAGVFSLTVVRM